MTIQHLRERLAQLPPVQDGAFEVELSPLYDELQQASRDFVEVSEGLVSLAEDTTDQNSVDDTGFKAFYLLALHHRRSFDWTLYGNLIDHFRETYGNRPLYSHIEAMYLVQARDIRRGVQMAQDIVRTEPCSNHAGCLHHFAESVAVAIESGRNLDQQIVDEANEAALRAVSLRPQHGKFYATLGRLLSIGQSYDEATSKIKRAIDLEPSRHKGYDRRIASYYLQLARVERAKSEDSIARKLKSARQRIKDVERHATDAIEKSQGRVVESVAFFAAVIALIISSVTLMAGKDSATEIGFLIVVLTGGLVTAFSTFLVLFRDSASRLQWTVILLGTVATILGLIGLALL